LSSDARYDTETVAARILDATLGAFDIATIHLGVRLGLYPALAAHGPLTSGDLAAMTGTRPRLVQEWCEQQAAAAILVCLDPGAEPNARRFRLPPGHARALAERDSPHYAAGGVHGLVTLLATITDIEIGMRAEPTSGAIAAALSNDARGEANRPLFLHRLASWLAAIPDIHERLRAEPAARVLDVACGAGWSSLAIARAYPRVRVDAIDIDPQAIALAERHALDAHDRGRVTFLVADAADPGLEGPYDLVTCFEAVHDMVDPVAVLGRWHRLLGPDGTCLIADARVEPSFTAPAGSLDRLAYGWSVLDCLPAVMATAGSTTTGAVMRPATLQAYAAQAGFGVFEILPIEDPGWRFYRLRR
jgi:2-polyprenyl-3-methyl-5-hydroxy-6-metoxy-1,4-benzoquinol methylase